MVLGAASLLSEMETRAQFQPRCDYLMGTTHKPCRISTRPNFLSSGEIMQRGKEFSLVKGYRDY
jgi:hypothetical protein